MLTVGRFETPEFAHLARTVLEGNEIQAHLLDEHFVQMDWLMSNAVGGVRLVVDPEDYDDAITVLQESRRQQADGEYEEISVVRGHLLNWLFSATLGALLPLGRVNYFYHRATGRYYRGERPSASI